MSSHIVLCARPYASSFPPMSLYDLKNYKHIYTYPYFTDEDMGTQKVKSPIQDYTAKLRFLRPSTLVLDFLLVSVAIMLQPPVCSLLLPRKFNQSVHTLMATSLDK